MASEKKKDSPRAQSPKSNSVKGDLGGAEDMVENDRASSVESEHESPEKRKAQEDLTNDPKRPKKELTLSDLAFLIQDGRKATERKFERMRRDMEKQSQAHERLKQEMFLLQRNPQNPLNLPAGGTQNDESLHTPQNQFYDDGSYSGSPEKEEYDYDYDESGKEEGEYREDDEEADGKQMISLYPKVDSDDEFAASDSDVLKSHRAIKTSLSKKLLREGANMKKISMDEMENKRKEAKKPAAVKPGSFMDKLVKEVRKDEQPALPKGTTGFSNHFSAAPSFKQELQTQVFDLDQSQVKTINTFYRTEKPLKISATPQDLTQIVKVSPEFEDLLDVPKMDSFVEYHQSKKHGGHVKGGFKRRFHRDTEKELSRIQHAAKYGILSNALTQRCLFNEMELLTSWREQNLITPQMFEDIQIKNMAAFEASNRGLEQSCRTGALAHSLRRSNLLEEIEVDTKRRPEYLKDPLTSAGILGRQFNERLQENADNANYAKQSRQLGLMQHSQNKDSRDSKRSSNYKTEDTRGRYGRDRDFRDSRDYASSQNSRFRDTRRPGQGSSANQGRPSSSRADNQFPSARGRGRGRKF